MSYLIIVFNWRHHSNQVICVKDCWRHDQQITICGRPVLMTQFASMWRNKTSGMCLNADTEWRHMDCAQQPSQSFVQQCSLSSTSSSEPGCYHHQCQLWFLVRKRYMSILQKFHTQFNYEQLVSDPAGRLWGLRPCLTSSFVPFEREGRVTHTTIH